MEPKQGMRRVTTLTFRESMQVYEVVKTLTAMKSIQVYEASHYNLSFDTNTGLRGGSLNSQQWNLYRYMKQASCMRWVITLTSMCIKWVYEMGPFTQSNGTFTSF